MMPRREDQNLTRLAKLFPGDVVLPVDFDAPVTGLCSDSRQIKAGEVFIALQGQRTDARQFAGQATRAGAVAIVEQGDAAPWLDDTGLRHIPVPDVRRCLGLMADRFYAEPSKSIKTIAITGTSGKTSVAHYIAQALELLNGQPVGLMGTLGQGRFGSLGNAGLTTPDCLSVHRALAGFRDQGATHAVLEASSHALVQGRLQAVRLDTAVFTNLSRDHLDYHLTMQAYAQAKAKLFSTPGLRCAAINLADPLAAQIIGVIPASVTVCGYQLNDKGHADKGHAQVWAQVLLQGSQGLKLYFHIDKQKAIIDSPLLGVTNAWNLLSTLSVLLLHDIPFDDAIQVLPKLTPVAGRMQALGGGDQPLIVVDYSHKPAALSAALQTLRPLCQGRLWCVFGCGGDRDKGKRAEMGEVASTLADRVLVTDDNPRSEDGDAIVAQILGGVTNPRNTRVERDRGTAICAAIMSAGPGDVVLVAGKGHETYQEINGQRFAFCDVAAVRNALQGAAQ